MYYVTWTCYGWTCYGIHTKEIDNDFDLKVFLEDHEEIEWVHPLDFEWEVNHIGFIIKGKVMAP